MIFGCDISDYQNVTSFHQVAEAGCRFVYVKATEGVSYTASAFANYRDRIRSLSPDLRFGAYHFMRWDKVGYAQAQHFLEQYTPQAGDLVPVLDCEAFDHDADVTSSIMHGFICQVEYAISQAELQVPSGKARCIIYASYSALREKRFKTEWFSEESPLWIAEYNSNAKPSIPAGTWEQATLWQYSSSIAIPGILPRGTDADRFLGDNLDDITLIAKP